MESRLPACLYIVVPCYNEEEVLPLTGPLFVERLATLKEQGYINSTSRVLFVDDGSSDSTWHEIQKLCARHPESVEGIALSRNRGHQNALLAGLMESREKADITISIDCDGQDDMAVMEQMIDEWADGCDIVYGVRTDRSSDSGFKRGSAHMFYRLMSALGVESVYDHADYRLMSRRALNALASFKEVNLYLRGMVPLIGLKSTSVGYSRTERVAGSSKYPLRRMAALAIDGITSLSIKPIRIVSVIGFFATLLGVAGIIWALIAHLAGHTVSGWASMIMVISFFGGLQMLALGVIGEYVGKTYMETKGRPRYLISARVRGKQDDTK